MRGKSSSTKSKNGGGLDIEKLDKMKEPHLPGAYIRSLVKQLTSSRTKDSSNSKSLEGEGISRDQNLARNTPDGFSDKQEQPHQPSQQHKKQVRRRLHTSRPYQERLLNMAEARREIVSALKLHRAAMKKAGEKQKPQELMESGHKVQPFEPSSHPFSLDQEAKLKSRRNPRIYASNSSSSHNFPINYVGNFSYSSGFCSPYSWSVSPIAPPPPLIQENLNFALPSQTLGLNLNLQDFNNLETFPFCCSTTPSSIYSSSSPSTSSSPALSAATEEIPYMGAPTLVAEFGDSGLDPTTADKEMAEIRSIGDQHQMEWNDTLNLVTSDWWFKFLNSMEIGPELDQKVEDFVDSPFDEVMEFPAWMNENESCFQHVNDFYSDDYFQDPALPCMEIEEIEGIDGDWLT